MSTIVIFPSQKMVRLHNGSSYIGELEYRTAQEIEQKIFNLCDDAGYNPHDIIKVVQDNKQQIQEKTQDNIKVKVISEYDTYLITGFILGVVSMFIIGWFTL